MYNANPYSQYRQNNVQTASAGELTLMLFEGCCKFMKKAKSAMIEKNVQDAHNNIVKAQNILSELMQSLDFNYEIAHDLFKVYEFVYQELISINIRKVPERLDPLIDIMQGYSETWKEAIRKDRINKSEGLNDGEYI